MQDNKRRVGIDLGLAEFHYRAPGTARYVIDQALALFKLEVPWRWIPIVRSKENPLWESIEQWNPVVAPGAKASIRSLTTVGRALAKSRCDLAYSPGGLLPLTRLPVFGTFFDSSLYEYGNLWSATGMRRQMILLTFLAGYALRKADVLFINSEYCKDVMVKVKPRFAHKFIVNYPGAPQISATPKAPEWADKITKPFALSAGAFSENKNQRRLLEAWIYLQRKFPDLPQLVLVGPAPAEYLEQVIMPLARTAPRPHDILLPGLVSEDELAWNFQRCMFYIHPSIAEGCSSFSNYIAMEVSAPIACANTTSHPEALAHAAEYFDPFSVDSMSNAIERMCQDEQLRLRLAEAGRQRIQNFTWEKNAQIVADSILRRLSGQPSVHRS